MPLTEDTGPLEPIVSRIVNDYDSWSHPFERDMLPEKRAMVGIEDTDDRARYLTFVACIDYQRDAEALWQKTRRLWDDERWIYEPTTLFEERSLEELVDLFREQGMRFGKRDAEIWHQNAETFYRHYRSTPLKLFEKHDFDAPSILKAVRSDSGFPYLGGEKIGPLWMRLMHEDVHPLSNITEINIPVDVQIRKVTKVILGQEYSDTEIRSFWSQFCVEHGFDPVKVDQPLWLIGTHWNDWGREYLEDQLEAADVASDRPQLKVPLREEYGTIDEWLDAVAASIDVETEVMWEIYDQIDAEESEADQSRC